jgi:ADP-ribose pyrophosphatase
MQMNGSDLPDLSSDLEKLGEKKKTSKRVFDGKLLQVYYDEVTLPDGNESSREWIKHPGASAVVPVFEDGSIMLLRQFRYPPRKIFLEVPAGKLDPGESPESTAKRELLEESGLHCRNLQRTGSFYPAIGYADEIIYSFVAWNLDIQNSELDEDEFLLNYRVSFSDALKMISDGTIQDAKTICTIMNAANWWKKHSPFPVKLDL